MSEIKKISWKSSGAERLSNTVSRQAVYGEQATMAQMHIKRGGGAARHSHVQEEYSWILSGAVKYVFDDREVELRAGEAIVVPPGTPHSVVALEDTVDALFFTPPREDWVQGEDQYLRG
jgi:unsaturated pyranuronate lyase